MTDGSGAAIPVGGVQDGGGNDIYLFDQSTVTEFNINTGPGGNGYGVDEVGLTFVFDAVPEPSSFALLSLAGLGLLARRRR